MRSALWGWGLGSGLLGVVLIALGVVFSFQMSPPAPPPAPVPPVAPLEFSSPAADPPPSASVPVWEPPRQPDPAQLFLPPMVRLAESDQSLIDEAVLQALDEKRMPGCVVLIGRSDGVVFRRAYGARWVTPDRTPMTEDTVFDLASLTKSVATTLSLMKLLDQGKLTLDQPVSDYLPDFDAEDKQEITLRHLLLHSSGLPAGSAPTAFARGLSAAVRHLSTLPLESSPGKTYLYSDLGFVLLGAVIQQVAQTPLDAFAVSQVFEPLGMHETLFRPPAKLRSRCAPTTRRPQATSFFADPTAPASREAFLVGEVHDPLARALGGVAGHAGLFSTADDLGRLGRMLLHHGQLDGVQILSPRTFRSMTRPTAVGAQVRTLGWDSPEGFSVMSRRAWGHGGFTGTSFWVDPDHDLFVIFLSNRQHPDGAATQVESVAQRIRQISVQAVPRVVGPSQKQPPVLLGIDILRGEAYQRLGSSRLALLSHSAARARDGKRTLDVLAARVPLPIRVFQGEIDPALPIAPEHRDRLSGLDVLGVTESGALPEPGLRDVETLVVDWVDVGWRGSRSLSMLRDVLRAAARQRTRVLILDRPNLLAGTVEGPVAETPMRLPWLHGLTVAELARWINTSENLGASLEVIPVLGYHREDSFEATELPWFSPSPGLASVHRALLFPALSLLEAAGFSVGRGTPDAFEVVGAPWINVRNLIPHLIDLGLPGVAVEPVTFTPSERAYAQKLCAGIRLRITDPARFRGLEIGLALARELYSLSHAPEGGRFDSAGIEALLNRPATLQALFRGDTLDSVMGRDTADLEAYKKQREPILLY